MLYMSERSHRVTFRVPPELVSELRRLPNQTAFVEDAIREALARQCPLCRGKGRLLPPALRVPNFAGRLQQIVRLGRRISATELRLAHHRRRGWSFALARRDELLLEGTIADAEAGVVLGAN
jgi:hypothetical protein